MENKKEIISLFIISLINRLIVILLGVFFLSGSFNVDTNNIKESFISWDSGWYLNILNEGYDNNYPEYEPHDYMCNTGLGHCQRNFAFFPVYPILVKGLSVLTNIPIEYSGLLISNLFFCISTILIFLIAKKVFNKKVAYYSYLVFLIFPTNYIFSAFMTESTFILFLLLSIYFSLNNKWLIAGIAAAILSGTRNTGVLVLIPMILIYLENNNYRSIEYIISNFKEILKKLNIKFLISLMLAPLGLISFMLYLHFHLGDAFGFVNIQDYWDKPVDNVSILLAIPYSLINYKLEGALIIHLYNLAYLFGFIVLIFYSLKKKILPYSFLSIMFWLLVPMLSGSLLALPRYMSVLFPMYLIIGVIISKYKVLRLIFIILFFIASIYLLRLYVFETWITV